MPGDWLKRDIHQCYQLYTCTSTDVTIHCPISLTISTLTINISYTDGADSPIKSPMGKYIVFFFSVNENKLKIIMMLS
jgi:hypothetical protein